MLLTGRNPSTPGLNCYLTRFTACKVSLQQRRYTFRQGTVLREVIEVLKTFILNIKDTVSISPKPSIKFLRKRTKVSCKRTLNNLLFLNKQNLTKLIVSQFTLPSLN